MCTGIGDRAEADLLRRSEAKESNVSRSERSRLMCFSATGSFALSGLLAGVGAVSLARNSSKPHRLFAAIPLLFAAQQAAEGVVWLTIHDADHAILHRLAVIVFLGFAMVVWPTWLPLSLKLMERTQVRRRILRGLSWFGAVVSAYAAVLLTLWQPNARVAGHSIRYDYQQDQSAWVRLVYLVGYVVPVVGPFFVSTTPLARTIGVTLVGSLVATVVVERHALTSVWCFFAAILSGLILVVVEKEQQVGAVSTAGRANPSHA